MTEQRRQRVGVLNFFPAFVPPRSGGELRYWHLCTRLSNEFTVRMAGPTYPDHRVEIVRHTPTCREVRFPKSSRYIFWHRFLDRTAHFAECSALVTSLSARSHAPFAEMARRMGRWADAIVHHHTYTAPLYPRARAGQLLFYDAHNVEAHMARTMFGNGMWARAAVARIRSIEGALVREADAITACSDDDAEELARLYRVDRAKIVTIPNGVDVNDIVPPRDAAERQAARAFLSLSPGRPAFLFIGSFHPPNIEAARFLIGTVAPALRDVDFLMAGKVCQAFREESVPPNVRLLGFTDEETKRALLHGCEGAVNPMFGGSGTNLKMLDFFAAGLPVVATPSGARGLSVVNERHALVAEPHAFASAVARLAGDARLRAVLARESRAHAVQHFSWDALGERMTELYAHKMRRRILVLNDFPGTPADSGGKVRLMAVARVLSEQAAPVTVLTLTKENAGRHLMHTPSLEELSVPRSTLHRRIDGMLAEAVGSGADDVSAQLFTRASPIMREAIRREGKNVGAVVFYHPFMGSQRGLLPAGTPFAYDSSNVEIDLKRRLYKPGPIASFLLGRIHAIEHWLLHHARLTACAGPGDRGRFLELFPNADPDAVIAADNGVDCARFAPIALSDRRRLRRKAGFGDEPLALFLASGHPPNAEAARFIIERLAPAMPRTLFVLAGTVCGWFHGAPLPENVLALGLLPDGVKDFIVMTADVALNPMFQGSGTNVKMLEYLAAGIAVVTTPTGARGIAEPGSPDMMVVEPDAMGDTLAGLLADDELLEELGRRGRTLAEERFDWPVVLAPYARRVAELHAERVAATTRTDSR